MWPCHGPAGFLVYPPGWKFVSLLFLDLPVCGVESWPHRGFLSCLTVVFDLLVILFP